MKYRITESSLRGMIKEAINEVGDTIDGQKRLAALAARHKYETGKNYPENIEKSNQHLDRRWEVQDYAEDQRQHFAKEERRQIQQIISMLSEIKQSITHLYQNPNVKGEYVGGLTVRDFETKLSKLGRDTDILKGRFEDFDSDLSGTNTFGDTFRDSLQKYYR